MMLVQHVNVSDALLKQCGAANEKSNLYVRLSSVFCQSLNVQCTCVNALAEQKLLDFKSCSYVLSPLSVRICDRKTGNGISHPFVLWHFVTLWFFNLQVA